MSRRSSIGGLVCAVIALVCATSAVSAAGPADGQGPAPTAAELAVSDAKSQLAQEWQAVRQGETDATAFARKHPSYAGISLQSAATSAGLMSPDAAAASSAGIIRMSQKSQSNSYYCGPAVRYEILRYLGGQSPARESVTQPHLAAHCSPRYLCTDALTQTPWYVGSSYTDANSYPMTSTLNKWTDSFVVHHRPEPNLQRSALRDQPAV